jgi:tripartite-type tricarboxylate transporter receptor subunit TctC
LKEKLLLENTFRRLRGVCGALLVVFFAGGVEAQTAVRILSGYPPGGAVDALARVFAEKLSESLEKPVVVETRTGAAGQIAATALKASAPDGNTLMVVPDSALTLYPHTVKTPAYDTLNDFVPVANLGSYDIGFGVGANVPASTLKEWGAWVKSNAKNGTYGSPGAGTNQHFLGLMLAQATGLHLDHVAYRGVGPAVADLLGGQVPALMLPLAQMLPQIKAGKIRILAHSGGKRSVVVPEVPTFKELGFAAMEVSGWYCIIAPAGIRPEILNRYNEIINRSMRTPFVRDRMRALDLEIQEMTPAEVSAKVRNEYERWRPIVRASAFTADSQ